MKKLFAAVLCLILSLTVLSVSAETLGAVGAWEICENEEAVLPEEAAAAFEKALEGLVGSTYKPVALLATQIVAGTNYCILCECTPVVPDAVAHLVLVYVYADLEGGAELLAVTDLEIGVPETAE